MLLNRKALEKMAMMEDGVWFVNDPAEQQKKIEEIQSLVITNIWPTLFSYTFYIGEAQVPDYSCISNLFYENRWYVDPR